MRFGVWYDITLEFEYPLENGYDLAWDTWAKDLTAKVMEFTSRVVRTGNTVRINMKVSANGVGDLTWALGLLLSRTHSQAPGLIKVEFREIPGSEVKKSALPETICIEENE